MLTHSRDHVAARIGYGYQEHPGEFLAMLALSRVPAEYPVRVGKDTRSVADLAEAEKLACRSGSDLSLELIGLSYYVDEPEWKNDLGETWSIERIIREEIGQPVVTAPEGGLNRLMGLSYAVARRAKRGRPIDGQFKRAEDTRPTSTRSPCISKTPTAVGARNFGRPEHEPRRREPVAFHRPRAGVVDHLAARQEARRRSRHEGGRIRCQPVGQPVVSGDHAVAFHAGDCRGGTRAARLERVRRSGV